MSGGRESLDIELSLVTQMWSVRDSNQDDTKAFGLSNRWSCHTWDGKISVHFWTCWVWLDHQTSKGRYKSPLINHSISLSLSFLTCQPRATTAFPVPQGCRPTRCGKWRQARKMYEQALHNLQYFWMWKASFVTSTAFLQQIFLWCGLCARHSGRCLGYSCE